MRRTLRTLLTSILITAPLCAQERPTQERPNIVYVMADELGYYELSCMGHPHLQTPNIDRLAREGVRFTQGLAGSSLCAPTRCVLMTGKHSGHTSVRTNGGGTPLRADEPTIASVLKERGYATGGFGKWGCGGRGSTGVPEKHGFDVFLGYYDQVHAHSYFPKYIIRNSQEYPLSGNKGGREGETYSHYVIVEQAFDFIRANKDQPFFCYLPITPPHGMFDIPDSDPAWALYRDKPWPEEARRYAAMVTMVDRQVGDLLALLGELDLERNTLVIFCGDNGGNDYFAGPDRRRGFHGPNVNPRTQVEFRGRKGTLYEGGLRIPMIARWPGRIDPGRVSDFLWYFPDVLPTVAELAGAEVPPDIDGISIVPELIGAARAGRAQTSHEFLYWELGGQIAVRKGVWKAVRPRANGEWELYDLASDVSEARDVAQEHPARLAELKAHAQAAHTEAVEGVFHDQENHEKDRRAKWGDRQPPRRGRVNRLPVRGLLPRDKWRVASVSSENRGNNKLARNAIDGDPKTLWHTRFEGTVARHPHELVIDLGAECEVSGIRYLARQDGGWNGAIARCEVAVSGSADEFGAPVATPVFRKLREAQEHRFDAIRGRYVRLRVLSEVNGGPWASIAEVGLIGKTR